MPSRPAHAMSSSGPPLGAWRLRCTQGDFPLDIALLQGPGEASSAETESEDTATTTVKNMLRGLCPRGYQFRNG